MPYFGNIVCMPWFVQGKEKKSAKGKEKVFDFVLTWEE
jgi:hypothetical protein